MYVNLYFNDNIIQISMNINDLSSLNRIDIPIGYAGYFSGHQIDGYQYNYYWNKYLFEYSIDEPLFKRYKMFLRFNEKYELTNVIPVFNTSDIFMFYILNKETNKEEYALFKDNKIYELKYDNSEIQYTSLTLDILTYKLYGIDEFEEISTISEYELIETDKYFKQLS